MISSTELEKTLLIVIKNQKTLLIAERILCTKVKGAFHYLTLKYPIKLHLYKQHSFGIKFELEKNGTKSRF